MSQRALSKKQFVDLYHGTTSSAAKEIDEQGIKASRDLGQVHLTSDPDMAEAYARSRVERDSGLIREGAAVVHVRVPLDDHLSEGFFGPRHVVHRGDVDAKHIKSIWEVDSE